MQRSERVAGQAPPYRCAFALVVSLAGAVNTAVADDSAAFLADGAAPQDAIGLVRNDATEVHDALYCTGTLISPTEVLTAGHCVIDLTTGDLVAPDEITFYAGHDGTTHLASQTARRIVVDPGFVGPFWAQLSRTEGHVPLVSSYTDLALVELRGALDVAPAALAEGDAHRGPVAILGYANGEALVPYAPCRLFAAMEAGYFATCPIEPGVSGAAVFAQVDGGWQVTGTVSIYSDGWGLFRTLGPRITAARVAALRAGAE